MFLKNIRTNHSGFSLLELVVSVAIAGGVGLLAAKLLSDQQMNQAQLRVTTDIDKIQSQIQSFIRKPSVCNSTFAGATVPSGSTASFSATNITDGAKVVFKVPSIDDTAWNGDGKQDYRVKSVVLRNPTEASGGFSTYEFASDTIKEIVVTYELKREYFSNMTLEKKFNIFMTMDPTSGLFRECGSVIEDGNRETLMKMCLALGADVAEWVEFSNYSTQLYPSYISSNGLAAIEAAYPDGKCQLLDRRCDESQNLVAMKVDSLGGWVCQPVSQRLENLGDKVDTSAKNCVGKSNFEVQIVGGKFVINCY